MYVHVPFCRHRCHYCDFNTYEGLDALHGPYVEALLGQIRSWRTRLGPALGDVALPDRPARTLFIGGGTPTLLSPKDLGRIVHAVEAEVGLTADAEVTVEANPETVDRATFEQLLAEGFNRFSIGVQATSARVLNALGRTHSADCALDAVAAAHAAGARDVNADLIYGSPWESLDAWRAALDRVVGTGVQHVSAYALTIEDGTPLARRVADGRAPAVDPDVQAERYELAQRALAAAGYALYETSNWARPGHECRHNLIYWSGGDYLAFGAGAHGHLDGTRWWCVRLPRDFIAADAAGDAAIADFEKLTRDERAAETVALGLRLGDGLDLRSFRSRFGTDWLDRREPSIRDLEQAGLLVRVGERLRVADRAVFVADEVVARLL